MRSHFERMRREILAELRGAMKELGINAVYVNNPRNISYATRKEEVVAYLRTHARFI